MRLIVARAADGLSVPALYSAAEGASLAVILHVHGWGGDFCSNEFVRRSHQYFPGRGIGFLSLNLRTSGYLQEKYSEEGVTYVGAAVTDPMEALLDIDAVVNALGAPWDELILQGHSFGTNVVRVYASLRPELRRTVYLSPADSVTLYNQWRLARSARGLPPRRRSTSVEGDPIEWTLFGMASGEASYQIPIAAPLLEKVLDGPVFSAWSGDGPAVSQNCLVVLGAADPIASVGTTGDDDFFRHELDHVTLVRLPGARHLFGGYEDQLLAVENDWVVAHSG